MDSLSVFSPETRAWFEQAFAGATPAQERGWPAIARGGNTLIQAPTGSGKTLAAFLYGIDRLNAEPGEGLRLLYVSPLKALNYDIERNLRGPLAGLRSELRVGVRTGDTPQKERAAMVRKPPDILITTPESLFLLLTSQARETLRSVETVIVDEVHAVAGTKRGAHLALSLERLDRLVGKPVQRIGLSATQRPLEEIGRFVSGGREIELVDAGRAKELDLEVVVPLDDMREPEEQQSIWPSIYPEILELVRAHRSTIVFVNNRRLAERLALRLNELAEEEIARAHHGSLAREQRVEVEELLKLGKIPCLVATSSLELGIDMGAVDLVIQVESPKSVARGLQRIGRAGHELGAVSKGRIFPKFRADLLESAVVARRMRDGAIEETKIPRNPLDVLAQQIVAICADEEIAVDELHSLVRGAYPFADLSRVQLENVLDMLDGRYPSDEFAELRARVVWDRTGGVVRGRQGARRLAVTNAGTIPDRGLFGVYLVEGGGRVGELDEEMVYEARAGQTFLLGASTWRIEEITRDRVLVSPAPGVPGAVPFWKGEGVGRPYELGEAIGATSRELVALSDEKALAKLKDEHSLDDRAARNLIAFLAEQQAATGAVPSDRTIVVERFRDEIGDWRLCILTPFGGRVHAPWALALGARLRESLGLEAQAIWSDDGIAIHLPDSDAAAADRRRAARPRAGRGAGHAGARRHGALRRALPRERGAVAADPAAPARRAHAAVAAAPEGAVAAPGGPALPGLPGRARDLPRMPPGRLRPALAEEAPAGPAHAADRPRGRRDGVGLALRGLAALRLRRQLHVRGRHAGRRAAGAGALARPRPAARAARPGGAARPDRPGRARRGRGASCAATRARPDELHDLLRRRGDLRDDEYDAELAEPLLAERRAVHVRVAGEQRLIAAEDAGRYRDALGAMPPGGLPEAFLEADEEPLHSLLRRFARSRGPVHDRRGERALRPRRRAGPAGARARRPARPRRAAPGRERARVVRPGGPAAPAPRVAGRAAARGRAGRAGRVRPLPAELAGDRPARDAARGAGAAAGARASGRALGVRGAAAPRARLPARSSSMRSVPRARSSGSAPGSIASPSTSEGTRRCSARRPPPTGRSARCTSACARHSAGARSSGTTCSPTPGWKRRRRCPRSGISSGPARSRTTRGRRFVPDAATRRRRQRQRPPRRFSRRRAGEITATQGRWSLTGRLFAGRPDRRALAELMLERQGIVVRDGVRAEGVPGGYGAVYGELKALETLGLCRRGYFVEGLGGAQFALGGAVERLRELKPKDGETKEPLVLAAADPAQPYGAALPWPKRAGARAARVAGAHVVLLGGEPALYVERGGRSLVPLREPEEEWLREALTALVAHVKGGGRKRLAVERFDSKPVGDTEIMPLLLEAGFVAGPRRAVLRP